MIIDMKYSYVVAAVTGAASLAGLATYVLYQKWLKTKLNSQFRQIGIVSQLLIHPIKSCRGIDVNKAECSFLGLRDGVVRDRVFMVVTGDGEFVTGRQESSLVLVVPSFHDNEIWIRGPDMETLKINIDKLEKGDKELVRCTVWGIEVDGISCGDAASAWIQKYLGKPDYKIVYHDPTLKPKYSKAKTRVRDLVQDKDATSYADWAAYLIMTDPSLADLNTRLEHPIGIRNFRPNIVITGCSPYQEDKWNKIKIGKSAEFRNVKPCQRCLFTTINPSTGVKDPAGQPLTELKLYRKNTNDHMKKYIGESVLLGINCCVDVQGLIQVGDPVYVTLKN